MVADQSQGEPMNPLEGSEPSEGFLLFRDYAG